MVSEMRFLAYTVFALFALAGCQTQKLDAQNQPQAAADAQKDRYHIDSPDVWGGNARCANSSCMLAIVEHENSFLIIYSLEEKGAKFLDKKPLAYHPDSAVWITDNLVAAAVEKSQSLDIFGLKAGQLSPVAKLVLGFEPRNVMLIDSTEFRHRLLAVPYDGATVAWIDLDERTPGEAKIKKGTWCQAPWFPTRIESYPGGNSPALVTACRDDQTISVMPLTSDTTALISSKILAKFNNVPSMVSPSPSGKWLYVAFETGSKNARIDLQTGAIHWIDATPEGSVAVAVLSEDKVIWGEDRRLIIQKIDDFGKILETRWFPVSGFSTQLQILDLNSDKEPDIIVYNSAGSRSDVIFGPLWEKAKNFPNPISNSKSE